MNEDLFWDVIDSTKIYDGPDREQELIENLLMLDLNEINQFEVDLRKRIEEANDYRIMALAKIINGYVSEDTYIYFRCWLIGKGRAVFYRTLQTPDSLADDILDDEVADLEDLLYVAVQAAEIKSGDDDCEDPRDLAIELGLDYDSYTEPKGVDWTDEELPALFPKLCAKFNFPR